MSSHKVTLTPDQHHSSSCLLSLLQLPNQTHFFHSPLKEKDNLNHTAAGSHLKTKQLNTAGSLSALSSLSLKTEGGTRFLSPQFCLNRSTEGRLFQSVFPSNNLLALNSGHLFHSGAPPPPPPVHPAVRPLLAASLSARATKQRYRCDWTGNTAASLPPPAPCVSPSQLAGEQTEFKKG